MMYASKQLTEILSPAVLVTRNFSRSSRGIVKIIAGRKNTTPRKWQQSKSRESTSAPPKKLGAVGGAPQRRPPTLQKTESGNDVNLNEDQAIGQVITAQANFMRVVVHRAGNDPRGGFTNASGAPEADEGEDEKKENYKAVQNEGEDEKKGNLKAVQNEGEDEKKGNLKAELNEGEDEKKENHKAELNEGEDERENHRAQLNEGEDEKENHRAEQNEGEDEKKENHEAEQNSELVSENISTKNDLELLCVVRNVLKKIGRRVLVGDKVLVSSIDWTENRGMIEDVVDRTSEILDPPVANVNNLLLVFSFDQPRIDEKVLSRFLIEAESTGIPFSLVLNKVDLVKPEVVTHWQDLLADWGYEPVLCSADVRVGLSSLTSHLRDKITVILGPSGVGKSSLINALRDKENSTLWDEEIDESFQELRVGEVSVGSGRGRHTTRHVSLLRVPGGNGRLADTPGFSQPRLARVTSSALAYLFPEVERRIDESESECAFPNCMHIGEPLCAVGEDWYRHSHYVALLEEIQNREKVEKRVLGTKRESEVKYKVTSDGVKQAEPRLMLKKHRRASRKQVNQSVEEDFRVEEVLQAEIENTAQADLEEADPFNSPELQDDVKDSAQADLSTTDSLKHVLNFYRLR